MLQAENKIKQPEKAIRNLKHNYSKFKRRRKKNKGRSRQKWKGCSRCSFQMSASPSSLESPYLPFSISPLLSVCISSLFLFLLLFISFTNVVALKKIFLSSLNSGLHQLLFSKMADSHWMKELIVIKSASSFNEPIFLSCESRVNFAPELIQQFHLQLLNHFNCYTCCL